MNTFTRKMLTALGFSVSDFSDLAKLDLSQRELLMLAETRLDDVLGSGADTTAIEALTGTGILKRTGVNTWALVTLAESDITSLVADLALKSSITKTVNTQTADYTLVLGDAAGVIVEMNKATAVNLTVPPNSDVAFAIGRSIPVVQIGVGQVTVVAGAGVTIRTSKSLLLEAQYSVATLYKRGTNEWVLSGDLEPAE